MPHVYLADGHGTRPDGKFDPGATDGARTEQNTVSIIRAETSRLLREWGVKVTDEADVDPNYVGTVGRANKARVDLVVSLHRDWNKGVRGIFGFWYPGSKAGEKACRSIVNACARAGFDVAEKWVKARGDLYLLRRTAAPAALIEYGRVQDYTNAELTALGSATAEGIARYLGVSPGRPEKDEGFDPQAAEAALLAIKELVGVKVGRSWDAADYGRIVEGVRDVAARG